MVNNKDESILIKILEEIDDLSAIMTGVDYETFIRTSEKKKAVSMTLINIGELANRISSELMEDSEIPFRKIVDLRNHAAHGYFVLRFDFIWRTVKERIPELKESIKKLLTQPPVPQ